MKKAKQTPIVWEGMMILQGCSLALDLNLIGMPME